MKRVVFAVGLASIVFPIAVHAQQQCDLQLWRHVYRTDRFSILKNCVSVTGTVESIKPEPDGDLLVRLKPDPEFKSMLNARNRTAQRGALVIKPVCAHPTTQSDAKPVCQNFRQDFPDLKVGSHVSVTGALVVDHGEERGWREIHPVTTVTAQ